MILRDVQVSSSSQLLARVVSNSYNRRLRSRRRDSFFVRWKFAVTAIGRQACHFPFFDVIFAQKRPCFVSYREPRDTFLLAWRTFIRSAVATDKRVFIFLAITQHILHYPGKFCAGNGSQWTRPTVDSQIAKSFRYLLFFSSSLSLFFIGVKFICDHKQKHLFLILS